MGGTTDISIVIEGDITVGGGGVGLDRVTTRTGSITTIDLNSHRLDLPQGGIEHPAGNSLVIQDTSTAGAGSLTAVTGYLFSTLAAIGGGSGASGGAVTITGGTVLALGGGDAAGIGGGLGGDGGRVLVSGGSVSAAGGNGGAGIGGGLAGDGGTVAVTGGTVTATGGFQGPGIGGAGGGGTVAVTGGTVSATGGFQGPGIGGGGTVTVTGGTVSATGGEGGAGIGGGYYDDGGHVEISGADATVTATAGRAWDDWSPASAVGGGSVQLDYPWRSLFGSLSVSDGAKLRLGSTLFLNGESVTSTDCLPGTVTAAGDTVSIQAGAGALIQPVVDRSVTVTGGITATEVSYDETEPVTVYASTFGQVCSPPLDDREYWNTAANGSGTTYTADTLMPGPGQTLSLYSVLPTTISPFLSPVELTGTVTVRSPGSTLPLRFTVTGPDGAAVTSTEQLGARFWYQPAECTSGEPEQGTSTTALKTNGKTLTYSGGVFQYLWNTPKNTGCYLVGVTLTDGAEQTALVSLIK